MPININNNGLKNTNIDTKTNRQVDAGSTAGNSPAPAKSGGGDSVSLTSEAQQLSRLQEKAMGSSGIDQAKVDRIKAQIESGSYKVDVERLASKLAEFEGDLFGGQTNGDE
ncbi:flagellar biosynthesis anti-sigma factor FlgM [Idiomarina sp. OT37-5b]|jgi:negative regulator of flagellin synthesis FlgM|uniref:Negative regulator of flagellin synthesis n=1 Tax=Idiomarina aquatica TaxID=1327752 RepID=A0AA94EGT4_9GAMM|nr:MULTISPECIES: flagellar biosynthesis anti-sigma factor FlgM [Idiomarina]AVJ55343.1 flagellar biosynthesis anti-sigma factor FlgM [Idiomarina sp. OT37-5b]RUO45084.1 flagellar biosynthesis anti-sigma factor FlgM [Idiomarina aquatica]